MNRGIARALVERWALIPPAVVCACLLCFLGLRFAPGGPFAAVQHQDPLQQARLEQLFGLDQPWSTQWWHWLGRALQGDFGESWHHRGIQVVDLLVSAWPMSLLLGGSAIVLGLVIGLPVAVALHTQGTPRVRRWAQALVDGMTCLPAFLLGPLLLLLLSRGSSPGPAIASDLGRWAGFGLAAVVLGVPILAATVRWTLHGLAQVATTPWWQALVMRGVPRYRLGWHYGLGAATPVVVAGLAPAAADLLAGAVAVEVLLGIPGLGLRLAEAIGYRDAPLLLGTVACTVVTVMVVHSVADLWCHRQPPEGLQGDLP